MIPSDASMVAAAQSASFSSLLRPILWGTLVAGTLDIAAAMIGVAARGMPAVQAVKGVAAGWLGKDAFRGDESVVALGLLTHYAIMLVIAAMYCLFARQMPVLLKYAIAAGVAYGALVYLTMTFVVVPLSAFPGTVAGSTAALVQGLAVHCICVGLPIALIARTHMPSTT